MKRYTPNQADSKRQFAKHAQTVHPRNYALAPMRGGFRI